MGKWKKAVAVLFVVGLFCLPFVGPAEAQAVPIDYTKAHATWSENSPVFAVPTSYTLKCGTVAGGPYTKTKNYPVAPPLTTASGVVPISDLVSAPGNYFCVVTASNILGESANSTEAGFQGGAIPSVPTGLAFTPN